MKNSNPDDILVVDDNPVNLTVLSEILSDYGFEVAVAKSGESALKIIQKNQPDLILLDVKMPGLDGFQTYRLIQEELGCTHIPIIFLTALADTENRRKGLELGAFDYITKPFWESEVIARVNTILRIKRTEQQLQEREQRLESVVNLLEEVIWSATLDPIEFFYLDPSIENICGHTAQNLIANSPPWLRIIHPDDQEQYQWACQSLEEMPKIELEYRIIDATAKIHWLRMRAQKVLDPSFKSGYRIDGIFQDISTRKRYETRLIYEAHHDSLTNLYNRAGLIQQINHQIERVQLIPNHSFAVLFIDIKRFNGINDAFGHQFGDLLLKRVAAILQQLLHPSNCIARLGGDEFMVLLAPVSHADEAMRVAKFIFQDLSEAIHIQEHILFLTIRIGVVVSNSQYKNAEEVLRDANIAICHAKKPGRLGYQLFKPVMHENSLRQIELEHHLRLALKHQKVELYYQPIVDLDVLQCIGFEAIAYWVHPQKGLMPLDDFIPIVDETRLIEELGEQLLWQSCRQIMEWETLFPEILQLKVNVNLSSQQLHSPNFIETLDQIIEDTGISSHQLTFEMPESIMIEAYESRQTVLNELLDRKIALCVDDFGTGFSSLSHLHLLPLNELKIDRSFISQIERDKQSREIVKTIITLAKILNVGVVAEGVETQSQVDYVRALQCNIFQGDLFSKPQEPNFLTSWIKSHIHQPYSFSSTV